MAENRLKIRIRRILRSCKSKDQISDDVVDSHHSRQHYQLVELFSPQPCPLTKLSFLSSDVDGRKCPPASPIISPLNTIYQVPQEKKKTKKPLNKKKYTGFAEFPKCKYNGLFMSSDNEEENERANLYPSTTARRSMAAVEDSLAVEKRSSDPYSDFRTSMVEMIVEKQIFAAKDLENLLHCFLSLNSYHHHNLIIQVFAEIWEALLS